MNSEPCHWSIQRIQIPDLNDEMAPPNQPLNGFCHQQTKVPRPTHHAGSLSHHLRRPTMKEVKARLMCMLMAISQYIYIVWYIYIYILYDIYILWYIYILYNTHKNGGFWSCFTKHLPWWKIPCPSGGWLEPIFHARQSQEVASISPGSGKWWYLWMVSLLDNYNIIRIT